LLIWQNRLSRHAHKYQTITGKGFRPRIVDLRRWRHLSAAVLVILFLVVTVIPVAMLVFTSLQPFYDGVNFGALGRISLDNYWVLLGPGSFRDSILNTLILGASTATIVVPFTALCAWLIVRRVPGAAILDHLATLPLVFPAIILSVAFLYVFVNMPLPLYGTLISVIIASVVRYLAYGMRYAFTGALQIHPDLEAAATISGAARGAIPAHRGTAPGSHAGQLMAGGVPAVGPGCVAAAVAGRPGLRGHGGHAVRTLAEWPGHRACVDGRRLDHLDDARQHAVPPAHPASPNHGLKGGGVVLFQGAA
jgi:hypothetical protein